MKKILKYTLISFVVIVVGLISYLKLFLPNVGAPPELKVDLTPQRIERGRYLANHVSVCIGCHSSRDWTRFSGPPLEGTYGQGGEVFDQKLGFPGRYVSRNITPAGVGNWTDGELFRAITAGVSKEGKALFPLMPYHYYGQMDEEDIKCIIAYIRTLKPIENKLEESESDFPMNFIINTIPRKGSPTKLPSASNAVHYGQYMATAAGCVECHTEFEKGELIAGTEFGGGREFLFPDGSMTRSANITPDRETGIGTWTKEQFVALFRARSDSATLTNKLKRGDFNSAMPWTLYGKMTQEDLEAIYTFLRTVKPIKHTVEKFTPKT